jgi:hypothetical protein
MSRITHFVDNRLTDGGEIVSLPLRQRFTPAGRFLVIISVSAWVNCRTMVQLEGLGKLKNQLPLWVSNLRPSGSKHSASTNYATACPSCELHGGIKYVTSLKRAVKRLTVQHSAVAFRRSRIFSLCISSARLELLQVVGTKNVPRIIR